MTRDDAMQLMSIRLYDLLGKMFSHFRLWAPKLGHRRSAVGFASGGSVSEFADLEIEIDAAAIRVLEAGWDTLTVAERVMVEQTLGVLPWVFTARPGVLESAVEKLEKRLRMIG